MTQVAASASGVVIECFLTQRNICVRDEVGATIDGEADLPTLAARDHEQHERVMRIFTLDIAIGPKYIVRATADVDAVRGLRCDETGGCV
jgi:hypothetical protein